MAWSGLDVCRVGRLARFLLVREPCLDPFFSQVLSGSSTASALGQDVRMAGDIPRSRGWLGVFRASSFDAGKAMLEGMVGWNGVALPNAIAAILGGGWQVLADLGFTTYLGGGAEFIYTWLWVVLLLTVVMAMPNTQQIMYRFEPVIHDYHSDERSELRLVPRAHSALSWKPNARWAMATGVIAALGVFAMSRISEFLYFQF